MAAVGGTSETTQMYLRTVLELEMAGIVPLRARLRDRLQHSAPAISETVSRLTHDGLLVMGEQDRVLTLTGEGRRVAEAVLRKHQLAEHLLTNLAGIDPARAHEEACNWEHVISDDVERSLRNRIGQPPPCPYTREANGVAVPVLAERDEVRAGG
jgi:DtxR family Mn-dependent transcriptional regulator